MHVENFWRLCFSFHATYKSTYNLNCASLYLFRIQFNSDKFTMNTHHSKRGKKHAVHSSKVRGKKRSKWKCSMRVLKSKLKVLKAFYGALKIVHSFSVFCQCYLKQALLNLISIIIWNRDLFNSYVVCKAKTHATFHSRISTLGNVEEKFHFSAKCTRSEC